MAEKIRDVMVVCPGITINEYAMGYGVRFTINDNLGQLWDLWRDVLAEATIRCAAMPPPPPPPPPPSTTDNKNIILLIVVIVIGVYFLGGK